MTRADFPLALTRIWSDRLGRYGEPVGYKVQGVQAGNVVVATRLHEWKIRLSGQLLHPWSPVNNCTVPGFYLGFL